MDFFTNVKSCRLKAHNGKYLIALEDKTVRQDRDGSGARASWELCFDTSNSYIRFQSCFGTYLTATNEPDLIGKSVIQSLGLDDVIFWQPFKDESIVYFKAYAGDYLRANGGLPPWRNTVTHKETEFITEEFQWDVEVVESGQVQLLQACSSNENSIAETRAIALAYYANCSKDDKARIAKMFQDADTDANGSLSCDEFKAACLNLECPANSDSMFSIIDKDGSGTVDFEEAITFYYMLMNRRLFCDGDCKLLLLASYFSCVKCFCEKESGTKQFNLCVSCYGNQKFTHKHTNFLDSYTLLNHITPKNDPGKTIEMVSAFNTGCTIGKGIGHVVTFASTATGGECSIM